MEVGGRSLLDRVLAAVSDAEQRIVVGPVRATATPVAWAREEPAGGGPAAGVGAALPLVELPWVAVLAADLPFLRLGDVTELRAAAVGHAGAVLLDDDGERQWLAGVWHTDTMRTCTWAAGRSLRRQLGALDVAEVRVAPRADPPWFDCDTAEALLRARGLGYVR